MSGYFRHPPGYELGSFAWDRWWLNHLYDLLAVLGVVGSIAGVAVTGDTAILGGVIGTLIIWVPARLAVHWIMRP